jgi:hypothetical protein
MIQLTNRDEVSARTGRALTAEEDAVFDALVRDVTALMYATAPKIPTTLPIPDAVIGVASRLVIDGLALTMSGGAVGPVIQESLGGYSVQYASGGSAKGGLSLTDSMMDSLRPWCRARIGSLQIDPAKAVAI